MKKRKRVYFPLFSFFITVVTIKKRQPCGCFLQTTTDYRRSIPIQQSKRHMDSFFADRKSRSAVDFEQKSNKNKKRIK